MYQVVSKASLQTERLVYRVHVVLFPIWIHIWVNEHVGNKAGGEMDGWGTFLLIFFLKFPSSTLSIYTN